MLDRSAVCSPTKPFSAVGDAAIAAARFGMNPMLASSAWRVSLEPGWIVKVLMAGKTAATREASQFPAREVRRAGRRLESGDVEPSPVGRLLQHWRAQRRMSQLALATEAGVTPRHVSFVESGRANPSREMVLKLSRALDVPLRERNQVLLAAGYAPQYRETGLDDASMAEVRAALDRLLEHHEPFPAVVMDRHWNLLRANAHARGVVRLAARRRRPWRAAERRAADVRPAAAARRQLGADRRGAGRSACTARRSAASRTSSPAALLDEVLALPGIPPAWRTPDFAATPLPMLPVVFAKDGRSVRYFSMVTTVGTPQDMTLQELRVEPFFPA